MGEPESSIHQGCDHKDEEEPGEVEADVDPSKREFLIIHGIRIVK